MLVESNDNLLMLDEDEDEDDPSQILLLLTTPLVNIRKSYGKSTAGQLRTASNHWTT